MMVIMTGWIAAVLALSGCLAEQSCQSLGFSGLGPPCSDCQELGNFVKDAELVEECLRCCAQESMKEATKFAAAVLEVCPHGLRSFPHIEEFVNKKASRWPNLKVRMKVNSPPRLILSNAGAQPSVVRVDQWKTEHVEEYLEDKLLPS